jgi:hypothetical protein
MLRGYSYDKALVEVNRVKASLCDVTLNTFEYYKLISDMTDAEILNTIATPYQEFYWLNKGLTSDEAKTKISELQTQNANKLSKLRVDNPNNYSATTQTQLGYWLNKGLTLAEATTKISERQTTFSKDICIKKYGENEGIKRFNERQKVWLLNNKRSNFSKIS